MSNSPKKIKNRSNSKTKGNGLVSFKNSDSNGGFHNDTKFLRETPVLKNYDKDNISLQTPYIDDDFQIHFNK